jgi:DNA-binding transcriptional ArsR family regulator
MLRQGRLAEIGALIGDPGRANMLDALMDGRALTAKELSAAAGVTPQTASGHLTRLLEAGLVAVTAQGRHRYHRLASPEVASLLENIAHFAARAEGRSGARAVRTGPREAAMRLARSCYNHFAGRLGVGLTDAMLAHGQVELDEDGGVVTEAGRDFLERFGVALPRAACRGRTFCRPCLDWSERRPHLAGAMAIALAARCFELGWVRRIKDTRALAISPKGLQGFGEAFGLRDLGRDRAA